MKAPLLVRILRAEAERLRANEGLARLPALLELAAEELDVLAEVRRAIDAARPQVQHTRACEIDVFGTGEGDS